MAEMDKLFEHIDDIEIAMMTTRRPDGHLQSRAMATQKRADGADLWFVTLEDSASSRPRRSIRTSTFPTTKIARASGCPCRASRRSAATEHKIHEL